MTSLVLTSQIRFEVIRRTGKTLMGIFLDYTQVPLNFLNTILLSFPKDQVKSYEIYLMLKFGVSVLGLKCNCQLAKFPVSL